MSKQAYLVLADGTIMNGKSFGEARNSEGELIFNTSMTGYQEIISDPSNYGQIITFTYPLIGNYGINRDDFESLAPVVSGIIVKEHCPYPSNWRSAMSLDAYLKEHNIPGIYALDTRQLTRKLREEGSMPAMIVVDEAPDVNSMLAQLRKQSEVAHPVANLSTKSPYHLPGEGYRVVVLDFGVKASILRELTMRHCDILVMPYNSSFEDILRWQPDGVLLSNGPGNPQELPEVIQTVQQLLGRIPLCGVGLGHQLFSLACGAQVEKMKVGHRGSNYPVKNLLTNRTILTNQNHGYRVNTDSLSNTELAITHINVNDQSIEGVKHKVHPAFSIQYQPETANIIEEEAFFDLFLKIIRQQLGEAEQQYATF